MLGNQMLEKQTAGYLLQLATGWCSSGIWGSISIANHACHFYHHRNHSQTLTFKQNLSSFRALAHQPMSQWRYLEPAGDVFFHLETLRQSYYQFRPPLRISWTCAKWVCKPWGSQQGMKEPLGAMIGGTKTQMLQFLLLFATSKTDQETKSYRRRKVLGLLSSALWLVCRSCCCTVLFLLSVPSRSTTIPSDGLFMHIQLPLLANFSHSSMASAIAATTI